MRKLNAVLMLFGGFTVAAVGQPPLLTVKALQNRQGWVASVTNEYAEPATSYVLRMTYRRGGQGPLRALHWVEAVPGPAASRLVLAPGASQSMRMGGPQFSDVAYQVAAVVYADGSSAGDAMIIAHILKARRLELADLRQVLPLLQTAASDPAATRASVVAEFEPRASQGQSALEDHVLPPADRVCQTVLINMEQPPDPSLPLAVQLGGLTRMLARWEAQLEASRPALAN